MKASSWIKIAAIFVLYGYFQDHSPTSLVVTAIELLLIILEELNR